MEVQDSECKCSVVKLHWPSVRSSGPWSDLMADHVLEVERDHEVTRLVEGWRVQDVIFSKEKFLICHVLLMGVLEMASQRIS